MTDFARHVSDACENDLACLLNAIASATIPIRQEMPAHLGLTKNVNKFGDQVQKLDEWANEFFCARLLETGLVKAVYSEELEQPRLGSADAPFVVAMDPLDGSANINTNNPVGNIFGVYRNDLGVGRKQVAALYTLYGPITTLVYTSGKGVFEFVKQRKGSPDYVMARENVRFPEPLQKPVYGIGGKRDMAERLWAFFLGLDKRGFKMRWCGTLVADFNQVLCYGGMFAHTQNKLRLAYEARPIAFIAEQAGGAASSGRMPLMDLEGLPDSRTPCFLGSKEIVKEVEEVIKTL